MPTYGEAKNPSAAMQLIPPDGLAKQLEWNIQNLEEALARFKKAKEYLQQHPELEEVLTTLKRL